MSDHEDLKPDPRNYPNWHRRAHSNEHVARDIDGSSYCWACAATIYFVEDVHYKGEPKHKEKTANLRWVARNCNVYAFVVHYTTIGDLRLGLGDTFYVVMINEPNVDHRHWVDEPMRKVSQRAWINYTDGLYQDHWETCQDYQRMISKRKGKAA